MDEVKIETAFTKKLIARLIKKSIKKKYNADVDISVEDFKVTCDGDKIKFNMNAKGEISTSVLDKFI